MKESLQEATQRALVEGYKNLKENKKTCKKVESLSQQNIIKDKGNIDDMYTGKTSNKKVEAYYYDWRDDIEEVENTEANDDLVYAFAENLIENDPDYADYDDPWKIISNIVSIWKINKRSRLYDYLIKWYGSEEEMKKHVRSFYETNNAIYFETGTGYSIFDADLLGGNADGRTAIEFGTFVANGGKKAESKKVETAQHLYVVQGNYGNGWEDVYSSEDRDDAKARLKEYEENETEYSHRFIIKRPNTSVKDMYKDLHNDITTKKAKWGESRKVEGVDTEYYYEIHFKINEDDEAPEGYSKFFKSSKNVDEDIGEIYDLADAECGIDGDDDIRDVDYVKKIDKAEYKRATSTKTEVKKVEAKEELSSPDYLEKAFEVEVEYWLQALVDEDSNDEIGKKAQEVLDDKNKMKEIVNELVDGSDDLWEDIHRRIEELAGLHYRESSRVNESKKASW